MAKTEEQTTPAAQTAEKKEPKKVTVTIKVDNHSHGGIAIPKGTKLEVDEGRAARMKKAGICD